MRGNIFGFLSQSPSIACCFIFPSKEFQPRYGTLTISRRSSSSSGSSAIGSQVPLRCFLGSSFIKQRNNWNNRGNVGTASWLQGGASGGVISGLWVCFSNLRPAAATGEENDEDDDCGLSLNSYSHGKIVYTDYSVIGIHGDGRCLFRSVAHGACLQSGQPSPNESLERQLADELRDRVVDEFMKRREETEWFLEGDFDTYISQIKKPQAWGGEPELFMCSHVLQMPITVYLYDEEAGGLIAIAEYGQEYEKENPIRVLYHGGHYDALQIPGKKDSSSRLEHLDHDA